MDLHVSENYRPAGAVDHFLGFSQSGAQAARIATFVNFGGPVVGNAGQIDLVAGEFNVHRALVTEGGMQDPVDLLESGLGIAENRSGDRQLLENFLLGIELANLMM